MKVLILHGYSASNAGDGLLVEKAIRLVRNAFGNSANITLLARYPETFYLDGVDIVGARFISRTDRARYLDVLRRIDDFLLVIGVGGGYLRFGTAIEAIKTLLAHGPQLVAASRSSSPTVYFPQSIGPMKWIPTPVVRFALRGLDHLLLRDDRSMAEVGSESSIRFPDLAVLAISSNTVEGGEPQQVPVITVREVRGKIPEPVRELAGRIGIFDAFVQSTGAGNDDSIAVESIGPRTILPRDIVHSRGEKPRVVVAVRLHAALMALAAGNFVIHLAYERKGFGAFSDLGLSSYVHNVRSFDVELVLGQVQRLLGDQRYRDEYREALSSTEAIRQAKEREIVELLRSTASRQ